MNADGLVFNVFHVETVEVRRLACELIRHFVLSELLESVPNRLDLNLDGFRDTDQDEPELRPKLIGHMASLSSRIDSMVETFARLDFEDDHLLGSASDQVHPNSVEVRFDLDGIPPRLVVGGQLLNRSVVKVAREDSGLDLHGVSGGLRS